MDNKVSLILKKIQFFLLYLTFGIVPLVVYKGTSEMFELPKQTVFYALTCIGLICFLSRIMIQKKLSWRRTPLDVPLVVLFLLLGASSILGVSPFESFFGDFAFPGVSLLSIVFGMIFYWLVVQEITSLEQVRRCLFVVCVSSTAVILHLLITRFAPGYIPAWLTAPQLINASMNVWGVFAITSLVIGLSLIADRHNHSLYIYSSGFNFIITLAALLLVGQKILFIVLASATGLCLVLFLPHVNRMRLGWSSVVFSVFIVSVLCSVIGVPAAWLGKTPAEINLGQKYSMSIVSSMIEQADWKQRLLGSGLSSYSYAFSKFRPAELNTEIFWANRFFHSASTGLDWFVETGLIPTFAFVTVLLIFLGIIFTTWHKFIRVSRRSLADQFVQIGLAPDTVSPLLFWGLVVSWLLSLAGFLVFSVGVVHWALFWGLTGLLVAIASTMGALPSDRTDISLQSESQYALAVSFSFIVALSSIIVLGIYYARFFQAELLYKQSISAPPETRINLLSRAVELNRNRSFLYFNLSEAWFAKATALDAAAQDRTAVYQALAASIEAGKTATALSSYNVSYWQQLAAVYAAAATVTPDAANWISQSLVHARELEPTNPVLYTALASAQMSNKQVVDAIGSLNRAIALKPNFIEAYLRLALVYEAQNQLDQARVTLERGLVYGQTNSDYLVQLGRYYFNRSGDGDELIAEQLFSQAVYLSPNHSDSLFALAVLKERQKNRTEALKLYRRVLILNPDNKVIQTKIRELSVEPLPPQVTAPTDSL